MVKKYVLKGPHLRDRDEHMLSRTYDTMIACETDDAFENASEAYMRLFLDRKVAIEKYITRQFGGVEDTPASEATPSFMIHPRGDHDLSCLISFLSTGRLNEEGADKFDRFTVAEVFTGDYEGLVEYLGEGEEK